MGHANEQSGLLDGIRVLDLSRVLAGPWAGQTLADLGAEVIKIERPGCGDDTRGWGPPFFEGAVGAASVRESAYYLCANRGKKSVTVDISTTEGQSIIRDLAARSDVLIENFKADGLAKFGLDFARLSEINPRLIYCSITGFGQTGPYRDKLGYDFLIQGIGGLMGITGEADGEPMKAGVAVTDLFTGMYASNAILAALLERTRSGRGQHIDIALFDVQIATLANQMMGYLVSGRQPARFGNAHPSIVPYQAFATAAGTLLVAVGNDAQFGRFAAALGHAKWSADPRFARNEDRVRNRATLIPDIQTVLMTAPASEWIAKLDAADIPCGPVNSFADIDRDPQVRARGTLQETAHAAGTLRSVASPMRFSRSHVTDDRAAPMLGADTEAVLSDLLGVDEDRIARWRSMKIV